MTQDVGVRLEAQNAAAYIAALTGIDAASAALIASVKSVAGSLSAFESALAATVGEQAAAAGATKTFDSAIDALGNEANAAAGDVDDFARSADKAGKEADDAGDKASGGAKGFSVFGEAAIGAARMLGEFAVNAVAQAGQAILNFAKDGVKAAGDFEAKMNEFASITGDSLDESGQSLGDFKDLFISLGRDLPVSTAEVQQAAIEMAKGGIEPATIAAGGLRTALDLAAAGGVGIAESAEIMAKQLGVWVDKSADAATKSAFLAQSADLITQAANASTVGVSDLALGLANAGGVAKIAGLSFRETVTTMALLSPGFSSAADAGTSFKTFLARLQPTTDNAAQAMAALNLLTADGKSKFYDATGAFIGMDKAAQLLHGSLDGMSAAQKESTLQAIFGQDAIRAAAIIAEQGADGYNAMAKAMDGAGTAAQQAARRQQGFNVAVDNIFGSLEAFQIVIFSAALPALTALINLLAGGINAFTDFADALIKGGSGIEAYVVPAVAGLTSAIIAWALSQSAAALPAILQMIPALVAQTGAFIANAAAVALAAAPYAAIAIAIGAVVYKYQELQSKLTDANAELLASRSWWTDAGAALASYGVQADAVQVKLAPYANTIKAIRDQIEGETRDLGARMAAGQLTQAQYAAEMAVINTHAAALQSATAAYNSEEAAILKTAAAAMTATNATSIIGQASVAMGEQVSLTAKDVEALGAALQKTYQDGATAVQAWAQSTATYMTGVEDRAAAHKDTIAGLEKAKQEATTAEQKTGIDQQIAQENEKYAAEEQTQAASYAAQAAAQRAHLGQMLIDYTTNQALLGNIAKAKAAEITDAIATEYGIQESTSASTFLHMAQDIDDYAGSSKGSLDGLIGKLKDNEQSAVDTEAAMTNFAKTYTAEEVDNFLEGKSNAQELTGAINAIPKQVNISVHTAYSSSGSQTRNDELPAGARAGGGSVDALRPYLVGEKGPEIVIPRASATVVPNEQVRQAAASLPQLAAYAPGGSRDGAAGVTNNYNLGITTNQSPAVVYQSFALMESIAL